VTAIDAAAGDVLVLASRLASKSAIRLSLVVTPGVVDNTLQGLRLTEFFEVHTSLQQALDAN
jgi:anti-anti-sigma regulatory factor